MPQVKETNTAVDEGGLSAAGQMGPYLLKVPEGTDDSDRIGRRVEFFALHSELTYHIPASTTPALWDNVAVVREIFFIDHQCNGAQPATTDLLEDEPGLTSTLHSGYNSDNKDRFTIISDRFFKVQAAVGSSTWMQTGLTHKSLKQHINVLTTYSGSTGLLNTVRDNNILLGS